MRIFIITMDDPVQTYDFIKGIINLKKDKIVGVAIPNGDRLKLSKGKSKLVYILSLFLIMGPNYFFKNSIITLLHKFKKYLYKLNLAQDPSILGYANQMDIPTLRISSPNSKKFIEYLDTLNVDLIINQSQNIIKKKLLDIPKIGTINRHNALLPKNRGRLTPFWVLYKKELETGVSIHFVEENLDSGDIIVQKKYSITKKDSFNTIVKKNYKLALEAMIEALDKLEKGENNFIINNDEHATYNSTPTISEAFRYRFSRLWKNLG